MPLRDRLVATDAWLSRYPGRLIYRVTLALVVLVTCGLLLWRTTPRYEYRYQSGPWWVRFDRASSAPPVRGVMTQYGFKPQ